MNILVDDKLALASHKQQEENEGKGMTPPSFNVSDLLGGLQQQPSAESVSGSSEYTDDDSDDDDIRLVQVPEDKIKKRRK